MIFEVEIILFFATAVVGIIMSKVSNNLFATLIYIITTATLMYYTQENLFKVLYFILIMLVLLNTPIER